MNKIYPVLGAATVLIGMITALVVWPINDVIMSAEAATPVAGATTLVKAPYVDSNGWTVITPSTDTVKIYVSSSEGNDSNNGLSVQTPVKTIAKARSLLRNKSADWMLLKKGDVWNECPGILNGPSTTARNGRSPQEPMVFTSYGSGTKRPQLLADDVTGSCIKTTGQGGGGSNIAVVGWEIYAHKRDPESATYAPGTLAPGGIFMLNDIDWFLAEDVWFRGVQFTFQDKDNPMKNISVRRSVFTQGGSFTGGVENLMYEENIFDKSTWYKQEDQTIFKRSVYNSTGDGKTIFRGNIDADGSSGGIQLRFGGMVEDNLFLRTPISVAIGSCENSRGGDVPATLQNNVMLGSRNINTAPRGFGIWLTSCERPVKNGVPGSASIINGLKIHNNILAHNELGGEPNVVAILLGGTGEYKNVDIYDNIIYDWVSPKEKRGVAIRISIPEAAVALSSNVRVRNNYFQYPNGIKEKYIGTPPGVLSPGSGFSFSNNKVWASNGVELANDGFLATRATFKDPNRTIEKYMDHIGIGGGYNEFMRRARLQSRDTWDPRFTAKAVNTYVRDGFTVVSENTDTSVVPIPPRPPVNPATSTSSTTPTTPDNPFVTDPDDVEPTPPQGEIDEIEDKTESSPSLADVQVSLRTASRQVVVGTKVTLTWRSNDVTACTASGAWSGTKPVRGTEEVTLTTVGEKQFEISCTGPRGTDTDQITVQVVATKTTPVSVTPTLSIGTTVVTTDNIRVRQGSFGPVLSVQLAGSRGVVKSAPVRSGDYEWVLVEFNNGAVGHVATTFLTPTNTTSASQGPTTPTSGSASSDTLEKQLSALTT